jgi:acyl-coenzyme A thioesterase PaaI-like protein
MSDFAAKDPEYEARVRASFARQRVMETFGARLVRVAPAGAEVLSIEFKLNLLSPAAGESFAARARVLRAGRSVTVCSGDLYALTGGREKIVATMLGTMMTVGG